MHALAALCVRRPVFATMLIAALMVVGVFSFLSLGVDLLPKIDLPTVIVSTSNPGASAEEIETEITKRIEDAVNTTSDPATSSNPAGAILAASPATLGDVYGQQPGAVSMSAVDVGGAGRSQPHSNMQPFLVVNYIICTSGTFPVRN